VERTSGQNRRIGASPTSRSFVTVRLLVDETPLARVARERHVRSCRFPCDDSAST
jgi:hypothetical protein